MIDPAGIPGITTDLDALAEHAATLIRLGTDLPDTGAAVDGTWQELAAVYRAPEAEALFAATGPVRTTTAQTGADLTVVGRALADYAATLTELRTRLDALRTSATAFVDGAASNPEWRSDPDFAQVHDRLRTDVEIAVADLAAAERDCAQAIQAVTAVRPAAVPVDGSFVADLLGVGEDVLNGAASFGNAALHNPLAALGLVGGTVLTGVSALGVTAGGLASATGVGSVAGVPLAGVSAAGIATGLGLAGVSGALLAQAAQGPDAVDLFATDVGGTPTAEGVPEPERVAPAPDVSTEVWRQVNGGAPLVPNDIGLRPPGEGHILDGDPRGGGHRSGERNPDRSEFPEAWEDGVIVDQVLDVARDPGFTPVLNESSGNWVAERDVPVDADGVPVNVSGRAPVGDVRVRVAVDPSGDVRTGHPLWGPGVVWNDAAGNPRSVPDEITYREMGGR